MEERVLNAELPSKSCVPARDASPAVQSIHAMLHPRNIVLVGAADNYSLPNMVSRWMHSWYCAIVRARAPNLLQLHNVSL